jgi:hypothetical protein
MNQHLRTLCQICGKEVPCIHFPHSCYMQLHPGKIAIMPQECNKPRPITLETYIHLLNAGKGRPTKRSIAQRFSQELRLVEKRGNLLLQSDPRFAKYKYFQDHILLAREESHKEDLKQKYSGEISSKDIPKRISKEILASGEMIEAEEYNGPETNQNQYKDTVSHFSKLYAKIMNSLVLLYAYQSDTDYLIEKLNSLQNSIIKLNNNLQNLDSKHIFEKRT